AEDQGAQLRALVLRRDYIPSSLEELDAEIARTEERLEELRAEAAPSVRQVTAPAAGLYSGGSDGYETVLTPEFLKGLTPSRLRDVKPADGAGAALGRIELGDTWYYAALLSASDAARLEPFLAGNQLSLRFSRSALRDFPVTLSSLSEPEGGRSAAVFRSRKYLSEVTYLRRENAQAVLGTVKGLRAPLEALRMVEDSQGKQTTGLYCVVGSEARFKPVEVLYTGDTFLLAASAAPEDKESLVLRPGDEVIVQANNLYDRKVVTQGGQNSQSG
ncbi:MAG: hypothetical protein IJT94_17180, partial [Oscillibacter sp.]|nr:hypothetical protein [Oscillibacter sp.]